MWTYNNKQITEIPENNPFGFIYIITHIPTNRKYLGRKVFYHNVNKKLGKRELEALPIKPGRKPSKKLVTKESDWKTYYGSNAVIKELIKNGKQEEFKREIIQLVYNKKLLTYYENKQLYCNEVLESEDWFNDNIQGKFYKKDFILTDYQ